MNKKNGTPRNSRRRCKSRPKEQKLELKRRVGEWSQKRKSRPKELKLAVRHRARERMKKWHRLVGVKHMFIGALVCGLLTGIISYSGVLETADQMFSDLIYQAINHRREVSMIRMIAIDDKTVRKYGAYSQWSRDKTAKLLEKLNQKEDQAPGAIGIDLDYSKKKDPAGDQALIDVCSAYKNVCFSVSGAEADLAPALEHMMERDGINLQEGDSQVEHPAQVVEQPFEGLIEQVTVGIVNNTKNSRDGIVRNAFSSVEIDGYTVDSFATAIYKMYMDGKGQEYKLPKMDEDMYFQFTYSKKSQEYTVYSFCDVLEGKIAPAAFADCIVFVGDYSDGSTFRVPNQRATQMHELDMQANLVEALLEQRTGQAASKRFVAVFYGFFIAVFFIATSYSSILFTVLIAALVGVAQLGACWIVNLYGYYVNILVPLLMAVLISIYNLIMRYTVAVRNQYAMEDVFKKYVDESVVSELGKDGQIKARIGVVRKDIAVLFVDIRGFTSLSECLMPEQIVEILNAYLDLVAQAVAKYKGTLDKFIGDAAMAVFNSPVDLEDYEFRAVCAALELRSKAYALNEKCKKDYGKQVAFGIGIQCGEAVIGNIGCERRMDYTAIGDTVNTASRLEGAAAPGQILISQNMMQRLEGRIQAKFAGEYTLKGKKHTVSAYIVEGLRNVHKQAHRKEEAEKKT